MKELELKLKELKEAKKCIERCNEDLKKEKDEMARMIPVDYDNKISDEYYKKTILLGENMRKLEEVKNKINIINEAMDILEGIGV